MKIQSQVYFLVALGVVSTDAWFWSWTGTTTLAPTSGVETEGSGSPAGSGDPPPESLAKLGAQIIDEGHGFQNTVQPWNETTVTPVLTTPIQLQNENGSETEPAGISSPISKPDTALPFCSSMTGELFLVPNYLNHSTAVQVQVLLHKWAWLLKSRCHHSWRSFLPLDKGRLPVECHALPEEEDDGYQCLSVSNQKGKHWLK
ncbi:unnamed protein product [Tetraodon nigroviridis]|uniref:(spotted green pufferfish) hypothetical protein n=1 Tax=Tetraodon nigroviridis TaxID=99883 RepID=Q4SK57_TETNG|nr:unnamed protein product [Tetraodon nigroviridis]